MIDKSVVIIAGIINEIVHVYTICTQRSFVASLICLHSKWPLPVQSAPKASRRCVQISLPRPLEK